MLVLLLAVRFMSPSVAVKLTPVRLMLPCGGWLVGLLSDWLAGLLLAWLAGLLLGWLAGLLSDWLVRLLSACLSFECLSFAVKLMPPAPASILESWTVVLVLRLASLSMVAVASVNETLPSLSFLSSSGFLAIVPSTSARLTSTFLCLE